MTCDTAAQHYWHQLLTLNREIYCQSISSHIHQFYITYHLCQCIQWRHIDTPPIGILGEHSEYCKFSADRLSAAGWCTDKHVVITVVDGIKHCNEQIQRLLGTLRSFTAPGDSGIGTNCYDLPGSLMYVFKGKQKSQKLHQAFKETLVVS